MRRFVFGFSLWFLLAHLIEFEVLSSDNVVWVLWLYMSKDAHWFKGNKRTGSFFVQFPALGASSVTLPRVLIG